MEKNQSDRNLKIVRSAITLIERRIAANKIYTNLQDLVRLIDVESELAGGDANRTVIHLWKEKTRPDAEAPPNLKPYPHVQR
jgi:hypothetical protein